MIKMVPDELKRELQVLVKIADSARGGLPLMEEPEQPNLSSEHSRVALGCGGSQLFDEQKHKGVTRHFRKRCCLYLRDIWCWCRISWLLTQQKDEKGKGFGCKSTTL